MEIKSKEITLVDLDLLVENPKNNNIHPADQIERLAKLIKHTGFRNPLVVSNRSGFVLCGHGRIAAAKKAGFKQLPVIYQDFKDEAEEYQYMTADNAIHNWSSIDLGKVNSEMLDFGPDFDIDMLGIKDFVIEPIEKFEPQGDEDAVPEVVHPITRRGDIWLLGNHRLMCGDSTMIDDVEKLMNGEKADLLFTDPPYNVNKEIKNDNLNESDFFELIRDAIQNSVLFLSPTGTQMVWCCEKELFNIKPIMDISAKMRRLLIWVYTKGISLNNNYSKQSEFLFYHVLNEDKFIFNDMDIRIESERMKSGDKRAGLDGKVPPNWFDDGRISGNFKERTSHPTQKPLSICERFVKGHSNKSVLDLFLGSGSTLIACEKTNRKCFGMELDEKYCDVVIKRWMNYTGRSDVKLESTGELYNDLEKSRI